MIEALAATFNSRRRYWLAPITAQELRLEATVVEASAARTPAAPWPYRVHVTTDRCDPKTVWCGPGGGDSDLILHYAVTRESGWAAQGPLPAEAFGPTARGVVRRHLAAELRWAAGNAGESYTVLNACRALRYRAEGVLCSKTAGGIWALEQGFEPELVQSSLTARESGQHLKASPKAASFAFASPTCSSEPREAEPFSSHADRVPPAGSRGLSLAVAMARGAARRGLVA